MKKKYIIRKNEEIQEIVKSSKKIVNKYFIVYFRKNKFSYNRYCVSVSKNLWTDILESFIFKACYYQGLNISLLWSYWHYNNFDY